MTDSIQISGIEVVARHGVLAEEKTNPQRFLVDVSVDLDLSRAGVTDELDDTIDYGGLAQQVHDLVQSTSFNLIERLAAEIANMVFADERARKVCVTVHKPQAPIAVPFGDVSVTATRNR